MSLRSRRLVKALDAGAARFLDSTPEDATLLRDDILGTLAHVSVLERAKVLTVPEARGLREALSELHAQADRFTLDAAGEDVHMNVEAWLIERVGDLGKKVHTARSRNDQVALDLRLWARRATLALGAETLRLAEALHAQAEAHPRAILPGHTHFQIAQPVLWGHWCGAHVARLARDLERFEDAYARVNVCPLGAGALAGTSHPIDPAHAAQILGFPASFTNSLDAVSDRDFVHELLFAETVALNHVSALAEELIVFAHPAFGFVTLDDAHATGSSLMPQKKNPDVLEVARAKAGTLTGALTASLAQTKGLPLAYNRDLQEQKRLFLEAFADGIRTVGAVTDAVEALTVHPEAMEKLAGQGHADATDLADYLVGKGVPFRDAHAMAAACVRAALDRDVTLSELPLDAFQAVHPKIGRDVYDHLGPRASVAARTSPGGTAPGPAAAALRTLRGELRRAQRFLTAQVQHVRKIESTLLTKTTVEKAR